MYECTVLEGIKISNMFFEEEKVSFHSKKVLPTTDTI